MTVPGYSSRYRSSQATDSASRWLVGSSSSSMSGADSSRRHSATRRFSPPESLLDLRVPVGGRRSASAAISSLRSSSQPPFASIASCSLRLLLEQLVHLVVVHRFGELLADLVEALDQREHLAERLPRRLRARLAGVEFRLLRQVADADAGLRPGLAFDILVDAGHDPQQRGLARAVEAEHADLGARERSDRMMSRRMRRFGGTILPTRFIV